MAKTRSTETGEIPTKRMPAVRLRDRTAHPFGAPATGIPLKNRDIVVRVVDSQLRSGRIHEMLQKGWEFVVADDLAVKAEDFGFTTAADRIMRGERGREVLMKMHRDDYDAIQQAKARENTARLGGKRGRDALLNDVAKAAGDRGDEAADVVSRHLTITDSRETVALEE